MTRIEDHSRLSYRFENHDKKRYYHVLLSKDLLGDWVITKAWGGIQKANGRVSHVAFTSYEAAIRYVEKLIGLREKRGYVLCHGLSARPFGTSA